MSTAEIGSGVFFDHATGLVIGETAKVGDNCTILHGVTLGGTGKDAGDRHPKVGNDVLIGAGTSILGNIKIGDGAKIGAGSIVLKPIPHGATAVGAPAKIIGWARENRPGSNVDNVLKDIVVVGSSTVDGDGSSSTRTESTSSLSTANHSDASTKKSISEERKTSITFSEEKKDEPKEQSSKAFRKGSTRIQSSISQTDNNMCIFRMFSGCSKSETLSFKDLSAVMSKYCSEDEIGEVYMELLKNDPSKQSVLKCKASKIISKVIQKYTNMENEQCEELMRKLALS